MTHAKKRHGQMVSDLLRTPLLEKAVARIVKKGDIVFDLGCGLGILSFAAIKAGAKQVYACDIDREALALTYQKAKKKGWDKKLLLFEGLSSDIGLPEKVDVILAETVGSLGLDENIVPFVIDARDRFLKKGGTILPHSLRVFIAPIELKHSSLPPRSTIRDLRSAKITEVPFRTGVVLPKHLLASEQTFASIKFLNEKHIGFDYEMPFRMKRDGILTGFAGWFECDWTQDLTISTSPDQPQTHWQQALLPIIE